MKDTNFSTSEYFLELAHISITSKNNFSISSLELLYTVSFILGKIFIISTIEPFSYKFYCF